MLWRQSVVVAETTRCILRQEQSKLLLRVCQEIQRVDHVCEVDLHFVILSCHKDQLLRVKLVADILGLLSQLDHEAQPDLLVVIRLRVPEKRH